MTRAALALAVEHVRFAQLDREENNAVKQLVAPVRVSASMLGELCGLSTRSVAELLVEVGDLCRFVIHRRMMRDVKAANASALLAA